MIMEAVGQKVFNWIHRRNIVYNTCWEDPRLDRQALRIAPDDNICMITSAGCNALDYALAGPKRIFAIDVNPLQNALLELKIAGIRTLEFEPFFELFGLGQTPDWEALYRTRLRPQLSESARQCWDQRGRFFVGHGKQDSFYFRGSSGLFAWMANRYLDRVAKVRDGVEELLDARSLAEQTEIFHRHELGRVLWKPVLKWALRRDTTLALLGVPRSQRVQLEQTYPGGTMQFIQDCIEYVFTRIPLQDNYFWQVYLRGCYTPDCCPEYLKRDNFARLKSGLVDCIETRTDTILNFLQTREEPITRFVLLDHMDWLCNALPELLNAEWQAILNRSTADTRLIWRSAGLTVDYVDPQVIYLGQERCRVGELLSYEQTLADELHQQDRVHTYGSFYIANLSQL